MIEPKPRRDTGGWKVELPAKYSRTGKRKIRSFSGPDAYEQAKAWAHELNEGIRLRELGIRSQTTVEQAVEQFLSGPHGKTLATSTMATYRSVQRRHVAQWGRGHPHRHTR